MDVQVLDAPAARTSLALSVEPAPTRRRVWLPSRGMLAIGLVVLVAAMAVTVFTVGGDSGEDAGSLLRSIGLDLVRLRWQFALIVAGLGVAHYLATALAARAASGLPLPLGETLLVQLAAAAANRVTPAGVGGSALTARYFSRRGLTMPAAVGAVSALAVLGAFADLLVLGVLVVGGRLLGLGVGAHQFGALMSHIHHLLGPARSPWLWLVVGLALLAAAATWLIGRGRASAGRTSAWVPVRRLLTQPRALVTLLAASGATTLVLAFAFVATVAMVPGPHPVAATGVVLVAFMLGSAAGSSVPVPAGLGSTEAALIAVLVGLGEPAANAVQVVIVFRLVTFWAPAAVGLFATRRLRRRAAI